MLQARKIGLSTKIKGVLTHVSSLFTRLLSQRGVIINVIILRILSTSFS